MSSINLKSSMPFPEEIFTKFIDIYKSRTMYIAKTKTVVDFHEAGSHSHDGYEFLIPMSLMPYLKNESSSLSLPKGEVLMLDPWESHGPGKRMIGVCFTDILIEKHYFEEEAHSIFGEKLLCTRNKKFGLSSELQYVIAAYIRESESLQPGRNLILDSICCQLTVIILRQVFSETTIYEQKKSYKNSGKIGKVIDYLNDCYYEDNSLEQLSLKAGLSRYHFIRTFKQITGKSPYDYLIDIRIDKAKKLLITKDMSITEIGMECGFNSPSSFSVIFRRRVGLAPTEYRDTMKF